ncbi:MAG: hypothetical protein RI575_02405 [Balneolaceae bacterium]|nr:hypothetical protein [Balneolaceae bacterium]MDR9410425.1 hypothetical protein [Balneolaceae bacterium]
MKVQKLALLFLAFFLFSCSGDNETNENSTIIKGQITVDPELDDTGDYSGIEIFASIRTSGEQSDTLYYAVTDSTGHFSNKATFPEKDIYPLLISRNNNTFGVINVVLANNDTVDVQGQLPDIEQTIEIDSHENEVLDVFQRVERNFARVAQFINAGAFSSDSVRIEINKWSDIYWDIYEKYPQTFGAKLAGETSVSMLSGFNDSLMIQRSSQLIQDYNDILPSTRSTLLEYYAETEGLDRALTFIENLKSKEIGLEDQMDLEMERIELLYDSSETLQATQVLDQFKETYAEYDAAMEWAEDISYDLEFLAPGYAFPNIGFRLLNGDSLNTRDLLGNPYMLEITRLDNALYQQQFSRTVAIHQIYKNFELEIVTIPLANTAVTVDAFFNERTQLWKVAHPNSFDADQLIERLNLNRIPTRFLVDSDGNIIRRYVGEEYDDIVRGLQQITTQTEEQTDL